MYKSHKNQKVIHGRKINKQTLTKCFIELLSCVPDYHQRLALCENIDSEKDLKSLIKECSYMLDIDQPPPQII